jgi:methionyl-tRNA formyltransferase
MPSVQSEQLSTYWPRLSTDHHGWIDWSWDASEIERFVLAFSTPYRGASTTLDGQRVHVMDAYAVLSEASFHPFQAGLVYRALPGRLFVAARQSAIVITSIRSPSGGELREPVRAGARFVTPYDKLDDARMFRSVYSPDGIVAQAQGNLTGGRPSLSGDPG